MSSYDETFKLLQDIRDTQILQAGQLGKIEGQLEGLAGPDGRVKALERTDNRQWWVHAAVVPLLAVLHGAARKYGVDI